MNTEPSSNLEVLFSQMTPEQKLCFKQAIVQQTIYYVTQQLPAENKDDGERSFIAYAQNWINEPNQENADRASGAAVLDSIDGGVRNFDYSPYFLTPAEAAGAHKLCSKSSRRSRRNCSPMANRGGKAILQGQALPELDDGKNSNIYIEPYDGTPEHAT